MHRKYSAFALWRTRIENWQYHLIYFMPYVVVMRYSKNHKSLDSFIGYKQQESPAIADKPARRESVPKSLQFDVPTTLSLTILADLRAFNCCCVRNPQNPEKLTENSNL